MDLSERAKIKQEIVKEIGYKTAINKQTLCEASMQSGEKNVLDICGSFSNNTMAYILADKE